MTPGLYPIWIYRGDTYQWLFQLWHDDHRRFPVDLLNATAKAEVRDEPSGRLRAQMDCRIIVPNSILVTLTAQESEQLSQEAGVWDLQITQTGVVSTIMRGGVTIEADVTDSRIFDVETGPLMTASITPFPKRGVRAA